MIVIVFVFCLFLSFFSSSIISSSSSSSLPFHFLIHFLSLSDVASSCTVLRCTLLINSPLFCQIVVRGSFEATSHLVEFAKKSLGVDPSKVASPGVGECVDATTESHIYQVCAGVCVDSR